jgi:hypothetical protein
MALKSKLHPPPNGRMYAFHEPTGKTGTETLDELDRRDLDSWMKNATT